MVRLQLLQLGLDESQLEVVYNNKTMDAARRSRLVCPIRRVVLECRRVDNNRSPLSHDNHAEEEISTVNVALAVQKVWNVIWIDRNRDCGCDQTD